MANLTSTRTGRSLESWIREAVTDSENGGECVAIALSHVINSVTPNEVYTKKLAGQSTVDSGALAALFIRKAEEYAEGLAPGMQQFVLLAFYSDSPSEPRSKKPFHVSASFETLTGSDSPTPQGEKSQAMRHTEAGMQLVFRQSIALFEQQQRFSEMMAQRVTKLAEENHDAFEIVKTLLSEKALAMHNERMAEMKFQRDTKMQTKLLEFAPALVNTVTGAEVFPQEKADSALVDQICANVTAEHLPLIAGIFPAELSGPLMARIKVYQDKKDAEAKAAKGLLVKGDAESELGSE